MRDVIVAIIKALSIIIAACMISYVLFACFLHLEPHPIMLALSTCVNILVFAYTFDIADCLLALIACANIVVLGFFFVIYDCFAFLYAYLGRCNCYHVRINFEISIYSTQRF